MKRLVLLFALLPILISAQETSNYVFHSTQGLNFMVLFNGITQNTDPASTVMVTGVTSDAFKLRSKFIFEDETEFKHQLSFKGGATHAFHIEQASDGKYILSNQGVVEDAGGKYGTMNIVEYRAEMGELPVDDGKPIETEVTLKISGSGEKVEVVENTSEDPTKVTIETTDLYEGPTGCDNPSSHSVAKDIAAELGSYNSDAARNKMLPPLIKGKCLTANDIENILMVYQSSEQRLNAAKMLYPVLYDRANVVQLKQLFENPKHWEEYLDFANKFEE